MHTYVIICVYVYTVYLFISLCTQALMLHVYIFYMLIWMHACIYVCTYVYMCICMRMCTWMWMCIWSVSASVYAWICICTVYDVYVYVQYMYTYVCMCMCMCMYTYIYIYECVLYVYCELEWVFCPYNAACHSSKSWKPMKPCHHSSPAKTMDRLWIKKK